jgi:hypothetical protein
MQGPKIMRAVAVLLAGAIVVTTTAAGTTLVTTAMSATAEAKNGGGGGGRGGNGGRWSGGKNWDRSGGGGGNYNYGYRYYYPRYNYFNYGFYGDWYAPRCYAPRYYYVPRYAPRYGSHDAYCHARYRSYNSHTGTYTGYDGKQHRCGASVSRYSPQSGSRHTGGKGPAYSSQCLDAMARSGEHSAEAATHC